MSRDTGKAPDWSLFDSTSYDDLVGGLRASLERRAGKKASVRSLARLLKHKSPAAIHAMLTGKRVLSVSVQARLTSLLALNSQEATYLREWSDCERRRRAGREEPDDMARLASLNPRKTGQVLLPSEAFAYIADWHHLPLKALVSTKGFKFNLDWIQKRLKGKVSAAKVQNGFYLLAQLGLLNRAGRKWTVAKAFTTPLDVPSAAVRRHHCEMMERAMESVHEDPVSVRDMSSTTFAFDARHMDEAKAVMEDFRQEFLRRFEAKGAADIYQFNTQFFPHTAVTERR